MKALLDWIYELNKIGRVLICIVLLLVLVGLGWVANIIHGNTGEHEGMARTPAVSSKQKGRDRSEVERAFRSAGFTNISYSEIDDLVTGWITKDGEVEKVTVGGTDGYLSREWIPEDTEVVIYYHTFPNKEKQDSKYPMNYGFERKGIFECLVEK